MAAKLRIDVSPLGEGAVARLGGVLDIANEPTLGQAIERLHRAGARGVRIDLTDLGFIDSLGIGALLRVWRSWEDRGDPVELIPPADPDVRRVFDVMAADDELPFVDPAEPPSWTGSPPPR